MTTFNENQKIGDIVVKFPASADIFKAYRIDFCCGGERPLKTAIQEDGNEKDQTEILQKVNTAYEEYLERKDNTEEKDWVNAPLKELVDHIVDVHHGYLYEALPEISAYALKIFKVHGSSHPELEKVYKLFQTVKTELDVHLIKEEQIQYPAIKTYLRTHSQEDLAEAVDIIKELDEEHVGAGDILKELRKITNDFTAPADGCATYNVTYQKLEEFESDLFQHIHLENNILFPRLFELQK